MFVEYQIKGCKKGIWGARITQSDPHSANRVSPINKRMGGLNPEKGRWCSFALTLKGMGIKSDRYNVNGGIS